METPWRVLRYGPGADLHWWYVKPPNTLDVDPGDGECVLRYRRLAGMFVFHFYMRYGTTTNTGAGSTRWIWELPLDALTFPTTALGVDGALETQRRIRNGSMIAIQGATITLGSARIYQANPSSSIYPWLIGDLAGNAGDPTNVSVDYPVAWASGHTLRMSGVIECLDN